jgi:hypothetical protein
MSIGPRIDQEYHAGKDKFRVTMKGYALSKKARGEVLEKLVTIIERNPERMTPAAKTKTQKAT